MNISSYSGYDRETRFVIENESRIATPCSHETGESPGSLENAHTDWSRQSSSINQGEAPFFWCDEKSSLIVPAQSLRTGDGLLLRPYLRKAMQ